MWHGAEVVCGMVLGWCVAWCWGGSWHGAEAVCGMIDCNQPPHLVDGYGHGHGHVHPGMGMIDCNHPPHLVDEDLGEDDTRGGAGDLPVEPAVEIVRRLRGDGEATER